MTGKSKKSSEQQDNKPTSDKEFSFVVGGKPCTKGRPRMSRKGKVYTPAATVRAEKEYIVAVGEDPPIFEGPVEVELTFFPEETLVTIRSIDEWSSPLRGDLDNYCKLALDGIQRSGVIINDKQVVILNAVKGLETK